jgi:hypothetical protein
VGKLHLGKLHKERAVTRRIFQALPTQIDTRIFQALPTQTDTRIFQALPTQIDTRQTDTVAFIYKICKIEELLWPTPQKAPFHSSIFKN